MKDPISTKFAIDTLMDLLRIEGTSGNEQDVVKALIKILGTLGVKRAWMKVDGSAKRIPHDYQTGNLIVRIPGTIKGACRMFSGHMDTVPLCRGVVPLRKGKRIVPKGTTALGGDNRTALGAILTMVQALHQRGLPHPPLTLLFTVGEESGLWGARSVQKKDLGHPKMGFNFDGGDPNRLTVGAIGADRWEVDIEGIASHAGVHPEDGVSAILIASKAIAEIEEKGWFGQVVKGKKRGTSNIGIVHAGQATNEVTMQAWLKGESRSHDPAFLTRITRSIEKSFHRAAKQTKNKAGKSGRIRWTCDRDYDAFRIPDDSPVAEFSREVATGLGLKPVMHVTDGGLDANYLNVKGVPTVTLGAGQHNIHTVNEYVDIEEYLTGCRLALALATADA